MRRWPRGLAKCDESKHDGVAFQLAAADLNSYGIYSFVSSPRFFGSLGRREGIQL